MRFLMRKYTQQCQNGIFEKKTFRATMNPNQLYGSPLYVMYTLKYGKSPYVDAHKHTLQPLTRWI